MVTLSGIECINRSEFHQNLHFQKFWKTVTILTLSLRIYIFVQEIAGAPPMVTIVIIRINGR